MHTIAVGPGTRRLRGPEWRSIELHHRHPYLVGLDEDQRSLEEDPGDDGVVVTRVVAPRALPRGRGRHRQADFDDGRGPPLGPHKRHGSLRPSAHITLKPKEAELNQSHTSQACERSVCATVPHGATSGGRTSRRGRRWGEVVF